MPHSREPSSVPGIDACLHCRSPLGSNDVFAALPVGRRFAFDVAGRRLWIVCETCGGWSRSVAYAPSGALSEILAECERRHRDAPRWRWTVNVSLARDASGVDLIRVDRAPRAELAAWRYGDMLQPPRWWRARVVLGERAAKWLTEHRDRLSGALAATSFLVVGIVVGSMSSTVLAQTVALALVMLAFFKLFTERSAQHERHLRRLNERAHVVLGGIVAEDGSAFALHADQGWRIRLVSRPAADGVCLRIPARRSAGATSAAAHDVDGREAVRALRLAFPEVSRPGVEAAAIGKAAAAIGFAGGPEGFLRGVADQVVGRGLRYATLGELPLDLRLPLQIAADEVYEAYEPALESDAAFSQTVRRDVEVSVMFQGAN
jgi:hypothetical protein